MNSNTPLALTLSCPVIAMSPYFWTVLLSPVGEEIIVHNYNSNKDESSIEAVEKLKNLKYLKTENLRF